MTKQVLVKLEDELYEHIKSLAQTSDRSVHGMIIHAIKEGIKSEYYN